MLKKYMIEKIDQEPLTETTGTIVFHLVDENGDCRSVRAATYLDENKQPQGVSSSSIRELPLIENLFSNRHKKIVEIEFDHFNKVYDRETDSTINQKAYEAILEMQEKQSLSKRITNLFSKPVK